VSDGNRRIRRREALPAPVPAFVCGTDDDNVATEVEVFGMRFYSRAALLDGSVEVEIVDGIVRDWPLVKDGPALLLPLEGESE
jgi:hypothetical protein